MTISNTNQNTLNTNDNTNSANTNSNENTEQLNNNVPTTTTTSITDSYENLEFSLDDIFVNLTLISKIEVGNKLIKNDKYVNIDTSFFPSITRWLYGQNHVDILKFINVILSRSFEYNDKLTREKTEESRQNVIRLNNTLTNVIGGLSNLMQTYHYDKLAQSSIEVMINTIRSNLNLQLKHIHYVYEDHNTNNTNANAITTANITNTTNTNVLAINSNKHIDDDDKSRCNSNYENENDNDNEKNNLSSSIHNNTHNNHLNNHHYSKKKRIIYKQNN